MGNLLGKNGKKAGILLLFAAGLYLGFRFLLPLAAPFVLAFLVVYLTYPKLDKIHRRLHIRKEILLAGFLLLLTGALLTLAWCLLRWGAGHAAGIGDGLMGAQQRMASLLHGCCCLLEENFGIDGARTEQIVIERMEIFANELQVNLWPEAAKQSWLYLKKMAGAAAFFGVSFIASLLLCRDYEGFLEKLQEYPQLDMLWHFLEKTVGAIGGYLKAQALILCAICLIAVAGLWLGRVGGALWLGLLAGCLDALPFIGTGIVLMPVALWQLLEKNWAGAVAASVSYLLCIAARELLEPRLLGKQLGISPVLMLLSVYAGIRLFGLSGIFLGPLYAVLFREGCRQML